ncbi:MAG: winged helix-turn-helix domain-containing protein [Gemmatimonadota bacterium]
MSDSPTVEFGDFQLDLERGELRLQGEVCMLAQLPTQVLVYLVQRRGQVCLRSEIEELVWGGSVIGFDDRLNTCIATIRQILGDSAHSPTYIRTVRKRGYMFAVPAGAAMAPATDLADDSSAASPRRARWPALSLRAAAALLIGLSAAWTVTQLRQPDAGAPFESWDGAANGEPEYEYYLQAVQYLRSPGWQNIAKAKELLDRTVSRQPAFAQGQARHAMVHSLLAARYGNTEYLAFANAALDRAATTDSLLPEVFLARGYLHWQGYQDYDRALLELRRADSLDPDNPEILSAIGSVLQQKGEWPDARIYFEQTLHLDPRAYDAARSLAAGYAQIGDYEKADRFLRRAISIEPQFGPLYSARARLSLLRNGDPDRAMAIIGEGEQRGAGSAAELITVSRALTRVLGKRVAEVAALEHPPKRYSPLHWDLNMAWLHRAIGDHVDEIRHYETAAWLLETRLKRSSADQPGYALEVILLGEAYAGLGRREEAIRLAERALATTTVSRNAVASGYVRRRAAELLISASAVERALQVLEEIRQEPSVITPYLLEIDPAWNSIRTDSRFRAILTT